MRLNVKLHIKFRAFDMDFGVSERLWHFPLIGLQMEPKELVKWSGHGIALDIWVDEVPQTPVPVVPPHASGPRGAKAEQ